jgi:hydroxyacylglutathione hydrolase
MLHVQSFTFNPFQENTIVVYDEGRNCFVVDPGCADDTERTELVNFIEKNRLKVQLLLNTHCHIDHVLGNYFVKEKFKTRLLIHAKDEPVLKAQKAYASSYGFFQFDETLPDAYMEEGDTLKLGNEILKVIFVPGHSPGHVAFYNEKNKILIGGDVLFYNSIGRTDLPGGNYEQLISSIHEKLFTLPDDVKVFPGHGPATTIGFEKKTNPFCALTNAN